MTTIESVLRKAMDSVIASGEIEKAIEEQLHKSVAHAIRQSLEPYSEFSKQLAKTIQEAIGLHGKLDLPSYNDAILKITRRLLAEAMDNAIQRQVVGDLETLLSPPPESIKLSTLVELFVKHVKEHEYGCYCDGSHTVTAILNEGRYKGFHELFLDKETGKLEKDCDIQIGIHNGELYRLQLGKYNDLKGLFIGPLYGFEQALFAMKAAGTKLEIDCDPSYIDLTIPSAE